MIRLSSFNQVGKLLALRGLWQFIVLQSVAVPFFLSRGLDNGDIFWLQTLFFGTLCLLDVPTSIMAERWGLRCSLLVGCGLKGAGGLLLMLDHGSIPIFLAYGLIGAGNAFYSGLDYTLIYNHLARQSEREANLKRIQAISHGITLSSIMVSGIGGAIVADLFGFQVLIACNAVLAWLSFLLAISIRDELTTKSLSGLRNHQLLHEALKITISPQRRAKVLILVLSGVISAIFPYLLQLQVLQLKESLMFLGYLFAFQNGVGAGFGFALSKIVRSDHMKIFASTPSIVFLWLLSLGFLALGGWPGFILAILTVELARALATVVISSDFHLSFEGVSRPTVNSLMTFSSRLVISIATFLLGIASQYMSISTVCLTVASALAISTIFLTPALDIEPLNASKRIK